MSIILKYAMLFVILMNNAFGAEVINDVFFIDRLLMSDSLGNVQGSYKLPKRNILKFNNKSKNIFYYANIGILNPRKKEYLVEYFCVDGHGNMIFHREEKIKISQWRKTFFEKDTSIVSGTIDFAFNPMENSLIIGQFIPLLSGKNYFIKLYIEKQLIGLTEFIYKNKLN